jgi:integrase
MAIWTPEQLRTFLTHVAADGLYAMWLTIITTGMRRGEVAGLGCEHLDLDGAELLIRRTRVDYRVVNSEPKTEKGRRTVRWTWAKGRIP